MSELADILQQIQEAVNTDGVTVEIKGDDLIVTFPDGTVKIFEGAVHVMSSGSATYNDDMGDLIDVLDAQGVIPPVVMDFSIPAVENGPSVFEQVVDIATAEVVDEYEPEPEDCLIYIPPAPVCDCEPEFDREEFNYMKVWFFGIGTNGNDWIQGSYFGDLIFAGDGDDYINGGNGTDFIFGGDGNDYIYGGDGRGWDFLYGEDGNDILVGGDGRSYLYGGDGDDCLYGGEGSDRLYGGDGDDVLNGGHGTDKLYGGDGDDVLIVDSADLQNYHGVVDGGDGFDRVDLSNAGNDFYDFGNVSNIEMLDMEDGVGDDTMRLDALDVIDMTDNDNELFIIGDEGDVLYLMDEQGSEYRSDWIKVDEGCLGSDGNVYDTYTMDGATVFVDTDILVQQTYVDV